MVDVEQGLALSMEYVEGTDIKQLARDRAGRIKVVKVNQRTLDLFAAASQDELIARLGEVFRDDMHAQVAHELNQLWEGQLSYANQSVNYALDGRRLDVQIRARVLPGYDAE